MTRDPYQRLGGVKTSKIACLLENENIMSIVKSCIYLGVMGLLVPLQSRGQEASEAEVGQAGDEIVVVLHGLARSSWSMTKIQRHLEREGYLVVNVNYPSTRHPIEYLSDEMLADVVARCCPDATVHFVTHSMGGIITRYYLEGRRLPNLGRVVMLSPPSQGSEVVDALKNNGLFKRVNGPAGGQLGTDPESIPSKLGPVAFELGVIAGNKSIDPLFSLMIPGPDDGKVAVERTRVEGMQDFLVMPYSHTFIMRQPDVMQQVAHFLRYGVFDRSGRY